MVVRRVPPVALAFALVAAALVATAWSTRSTVIDASSSVRDGYAFAIQQAVRADLVELDAPPTDADLAQIVHEHTAEGLRYVATVDNKGKIGATAGRPVGGPPDRGARKALEIQRVGDRIRVEMRSPFRRAWGGTRASWWIVMEIDPIQGDALSSAATRTVAVGGLAALVLLAAAIVLVRRELHRANRERARERERRLASLGEMSAVLAHEIRNPLASLKGNAQLLAGSLPDGDKARAKADRVVDEAIRLEKLTADLLAFVRTGELVRAPTAPAQLVRDAVAAVTTTEPIAIDDAGAPATWSLDGARIREVLVNLLDNAVAAGPPVRASVRADGTKLVIEICDGGPGVAPDDRARIFEPFFTGKTRGTGLGLAIARRVVELHRGILTVDDAPGGGARFRVEIPET